MSLQEFVLAQNLSEEIFAKSNLSTFIFEQIRIIINLNALADVVIGLELSGADVEVDVPLAVVHLRREEVACEFPDLLWPSS